MSRALLVLDTDFQRQRAQEWVWAAKHGSRVEFKGPRRTLDQNSLLWALLTDVAVHMRKTAGLEYSTEEWKHIFLHGWGREVHFLPALDGKGVVPIPQSSSDLSKEEMTDFIEYILKEGAERGVTFHNPNEQPDSTQSPAQSGLSDGDQSATAISVASPSADDAETSETGDQSLTETAKDAHGGPSGSPVSEPNPEYSRAKCIEKMLAIATNEKDYPDRQERVDLLAESADMWLAHHDKSFVNPVFERCKAVIKGENDAAAARRYLETL